MHPLVASTMAGHLPLCVSLDGYLGPGHPVGACLSGGPKSSSGNPLPTIQMPGICPNNPGLASLRSLAPCQIIICGNGALRVFFSSILPLLSSKIKNWGSDSLWNFGGSERRESCALFHYVG